MIAVKPIVLLSLFCLIGHVISVGNDFAGKPSEIGSHRRRRALLFPDPSTVLLIFGLGTPLQLDRESVIVGMFTKMQYNLPTNSTDFTVPGVYYTRSTGKSRWSIYKLLEKLLRLYGFGGKECLLKAICEASYAPFDRDHGLLGQLVQTFLRPSSTVEEYEEYGDREYSSAEKLGELQQSAEGCHALYPECHRSVLDVFSTVITRGVPMEI